VNCISGEGGGIHLTYCLDESISSFAYAESPERRAGDPTAGVGAFARGESSVVDQDSDVGLNSFGPNPTANFAGAEGRE